MIGQVKKQAFDDGFGLSLTGRTLPIALLRAREVVMERFRPLLVDHGFTEQQWRVLRVLNEVDELDATQLAKRASILLPSLTRIIRILEKRDLIETRKDPQDGRRALARLTPDGLREIQTIAPQSVAIYQDIEARFGSDRISSLLDEIEALIDAVEQSDPVQTP